MKKLILLVFLSIAFLKAKAQFFESGQDPARIKWNQIVTPDFQIIFPAPFEKEAQRLANALELAYEYDTRTLHHQPKKISVILHTYSAEGNAFVAWAPKRSELFTISPQDIYPQDWLQQLALHEYRHVVQLDKMQQGFTKILYFLFGQQITAGVFGLYIPLWFAEGDAVAAETALSATGRGRLPSFEMEMRAQVTGRKIYSYEKAVFGSYKDFVPSHYPLGYLLVANGRKRYGASLWENMINFVARHPYHPMAFSHAIKKSTGLSKWRYYRSTMQELDSLWRKQHNELHYTPFEKKNTRRRKVYTSYRFPQWLNDSTILAQKSGLADIEKYMVLKPEGKEKRLFIPGYMSPVWLSARKDVIAWTEFGFDKRWENRLYSDIITYNTKAHQRKRLSRREFLFAPNLSYDGRAIVAVEATPANSYSLVILDATNGKRLKSISHPSNAFLQTPTWSEDGKFIATIVLTAEGKSIAVVDTASGTFEVLLPFSFKDISHPVKYGEYVYYHGIYSGIDNIYAFHLSSRKIYQVTSSVYGAFEPVISPDGKRLLYSDYSPMGYNVAEVTLDSSKWKALEEVKDNSIRLYETLALQEPGIVKFDSLPSKTYEVKRYYKFPHLWNLHSWAPVSVSGSSLVSPGVTVLSQNKLSTLTATLSYGYNYNERTNSITADVSYKAWYPVIDFSVTNGGRASSYADSTNKIRDYSWHENILTLGISQPLNLTRGKYSRYITPSFNTHYMNINKVNQVPEGFFTGKAVSLEYNLDMFRARKRSIRDMRSRWGQQLTLNYKMPAYETVKLKDMFTAQGILLFPGVLKHHSLKLTVVEQRQGVGNYSFTSPVYYMRGYHSRFNLHEFRRFSFDYKLPLLYPDLRLGPLLYLQRVKVNLFYDLAEGFTGTRNRHYRSLGAEFGSDLHILNFIAPLDIGFRYVYRPLDRLSAVEFLFNIQFENI